MATLVLFGKLIGCATLFGFGEKRCRKNLPLAAPNPMKVSGLSNQWKTRDGLFDSFVAHLSAHSSAILHERTAAVWRLLESLESIEGPVVWVGTSHNLMHFVLRDTTHEFDHIPTFVNAETFDVSDDPPQCGYRVGFSLTGDGWEYTDFTDALDAAKKIERLLRSTGG